MDMITTPRLQVGARWRWDGSLAFFLGSYLLVTAPLAQAQAIRPDGRTATSVTVNGAVTDVRTGTLQGGNAFNSFHTFNVPAATATNLHVPTGAAHLVNIVRDQRTEIDGILNAIQDGRIGGNVWFANPHGFVVGAGGVVNVGSLNVSAPTQQFADSFFLSPGTPDPAAVGSLLAGTAPRSGTGLIAIEGTVNAIDGVAFSAGTVRVGGVVYAGARFLGSAPDFTDVVNANGLASGTHVVAEAGRIRIVADGDVAVSGTLAAAGSAGVKGGEIDIRAGGNLDLLSGADLTARGTGAGSAGGTVNLWADRDASFRSGAVIDARAGSSGDGGFIELSARDNVRLDGGQFLAKAQDGANGSVLIDPTTITATTSGRITDGANIAFVATDQIIVDTGVVISSRDVAAGTTDYEAAASEGHSGTITLKAPEIVLKSGSKLLSHATGAFNAGDITLDARGNEIFGHAIAIEDGAKVLATAADGKGGHILLQSASITAGAASLHAHATGTGTGGNVDIEAARTPIVSAMGYREGSASVSLTGTSVRGKDVNVSATTTITNEWQSTGSAIDSALETVTIAAHGASQMLAAFVGMDLVHSQAIGSSTVSVNSGTQIQASGDVTLTATNNTKAGITSTPPGPPGVASPIGLGAMYMRNKADAKVELKGGSTVTAANLSLRAHNNAELAGEVEGSADGKMAMSFAVGFTQADVNATARIEQNATVNVADTVQVAATNHNSFSNSSASTAGQDAGGEGMAAVVLAISEHKSSTHAEIAADISGAKAVNVLSVNRIEQDETVATSKVGQTLTDAIVNGVDRKALGITEAGQDSLVALLFGEPLNAKVKPKESPFRLGGAIAWADSEATATARIGGQVTAGEQVVSAARVLQENTGAQAHAAAVSNSNKSQSTTDTSKVSVAAGVAIAKYKASADSIVAANAVLQAPRIGISADVLVPEKALGSVSDWGSWSEVKDSVENLTLAIDPFTWFNGGASAKASGTQAGLAGAVNMQGYEIDARAIVDTGASLILSGSATGAWSGPTVRVGDTADDDQSFAFDKAAHVRADTDTTLRWLVGKPTKTAGGPAAIGGSYNDVRYSGETLALLREGAVVRGSASATEATEEFRLSADSKANLVTVAAVAGSGQSMGLSGTFTATTLDRTTAAVIDNEATVRAADADVRAKDDSVSWAVGGGLSYANGASVGIGVASNSAELTALAAIADNDTMAGRTSALNLTTGKVVARDLAVRADTAGHLETIAVAGAVASNSDDQGGTFTKLKEKYDQTLLTIASVVDSKPQSGASQGAKQTKGGTKYSFTLAGAGSVAVNETDVQATARIENATVEQFKEGANEASLQVQAVNQTDIVTAAAGGAVTRSKQASSSPSVGVAGAVAVNVIAGGAEAAIRNATVTNANDVSVHAVKGGETLSIGVGLNVDASTGSHTSWQGTGALSLTFFDTDSATDDTGATRNKVSALVDNATITGDASGAGRNLDVAAYNRTRLGTGGGALAFGGTRGIGGAVSYADVRQDTEAAIRGGSTVTRFDTVGVSAFNSMQIASGAAMVAASTKQGAIQIAGSVVMNDISNRTVARIENATVASTGSVLVNAQDVDKVASLDSLFAASGDEGMDYDGSTVRTHVGGIDGVAGGNSITAVAGNATFTPGSGSKSAGIAVNYNRIQNTLEAAVADATVTATGGTLEVKADSKTSMLAIAAGVAVSSDLAGTGSATVNEIDNTVTARISASSAKTATAKEVKVVATDNSRLDTLAGAVSVSLQGSAGGAAATYNNIDNAVTAKVEGPATLAGADTIRIDAQNASIIRSAAVAGAVAGEGVGFAGSISLNFIDNATTAEFHDATARLGDNGADSFRVLAKDSATIQTLAGSIAAGTNAVGGAISYSRIGDSAVVNVQGADIDGAETLELQATSSGAITALAVAASASQKFAFSGSAAANEITNATRAKLVDSTVTGAAVTTVTDGDGGPLQVRNPSTVAKVGASDTASIATLAGGAAFSGSAAVGVAMAVNRIDNTTEAAISGKKAGSQGQQVKSMLVKAESDESIKAAAAGVAASGQVAVGGSVAVNLIANDTTARIDNGARVSADDNVGVIADADDSITLVAGSAGIGLSTVGVGASVAVNQIGGSTRAYIDGAATQVDGRAYSPTESLTVKSGLLTSPIGLSGAYDNIMANGGALAGWGRIDLAGRKADETVRGVAVNASASHSIENIVVNVAAGKYAGVGGVTNVNLIGGETTAYVKGAQVNRDTVLEGHPDQNLSVKASDHSFANGFVGSLTAGAAGVGGAIETNAFSRNTKAFVENASVAALGTAAVEARSTQGASSYAVGGSAGLAALVGTAAATTFQGLTHAYTSDSTIEAGSLQVKADHDTRIFLATGGVAVGGGAGAASVGVAIDEHTTRAEVLNSTVDSSGAVAVNADSRTGIDTIAVAGAGAGGLAFAGNAVVTVIKNTTVARVAGSSIGSAGDRAGNVSVIANDTVDATTKGGAVGIALGGYGIAAGASVIRIENATQAAIENASVHSSGDIRIESTSDRDAQALALAVGGGSAVGISGAAAVVLSGSAPGSEAGSEIDKDNNGTVTQASGITAGNRLDAGSSGNVDASADTNAIGLRSSEVQAINDSGKKDLKSRVTGASATATLATASGTTLNAAGAVKIQATEKNKLDAGAGSGAVGGLVGAGGGVAITDLQSDVRARTTGTNTISAAGEILIEARSQSGSATQEAVRAQAVQGSAGLVGVGAAVARASSNSTVEASVSKGSTLNRTGGNAASTVRATDTTDVKAAAWGASVGAVAAGAVVADAQKTGSTRAVFGQGASGTATANLGTSNLSVLASRGGAVTANAWGGAGGVYAGAGAGASASDSGSVAARLGGVVNASGGNVQLGATHTAASSARAQGYSGALYAGIGVSTASASNELAVDAGVDAGSTITARSLTTDAASRVGTGPTAKAEAIAGAGGGLVGVAATDARASHTATVTSEIGDNVTVALSDAADAGSLVVTATNDSRQSASVTGVSVGGLLAIGSNTALAEAGSSDANRTSTTARIGRGVKGDAGANLVMRATGHDDNHASAVAGSGGAIAGQAAHARTRNWSNVLTDYQAGSTANPLTPNAADLSARHTAKFNSRTDSVNAGVVGGSGAYGEHDIDSRVTAQVADDAVLQVGADATAIKLPLSIKAENLAVKPDNGWDVKAASGGLFAGAGAYAETDLTLNTVARIGNRATVRLLGDDDEGRYGQVTVTALNSIQAVQKAHLDAGGAIAVALADSDFDATANASAVVGQGATVDSKGEIVMGASTSANVQTESYTSTYGLAGVAKGASGSAVRTANSVVINPDASLRADWNIQLQAGQAGASVNDLRATALTNVFNNVAIPITGSPEADALVSQDNQVFVHGGAKVRSVRDIYLDTTAGTTHVRGHGVAKDLYQQALAAIGSAISNAFGGGDVSFETTGGSSTSLATTGAMVDGAVEVGIQNVVNLAISGSGANPTITANSEDARARVGQSFQQDLVASINADLARYEQLKTQYANSPEIVAAFDAEIQRLKADRDAYLGAGVTSKVVWFTPIENITATGGDIHVKGGRLYGSGTLKAPGNASINIQSSSDNYIRVGYLKIPDNPGGHLYLNGAPVASNAEINSRTGGGAAFGSITTGSSGAAPSINVTIDVPSNSSAQPNLEVTDEVRNMNGVINLTNPDGSVIIKSVTRRDGTQTGARVLGNEVHITAGRDFVLSFVDGFYPVASDPTALWSDLANAFVNDYRDRSINYAIGASSTNPNGARETRSGDRNGLGGIVAGNNVFLNARILNINGLVQAGMPEMSVHLDAISGARGSASVEQQIANAQAHYNANRPADPYYALSGLKYYGSGNAEKLIDAVWNAREQRIEIKPVALEGSYMQLTGRIINTGGGQLRTIDGYGKIYIKNDTTHAVVLQGLDAGNNLEGVIRITDTSRLAPDGSNRFVTTEFRRVGTDIQKKEFWGSEEKSPTYVSNTRDTTYAPQAGWRFGWTAGQQQVVQRDKVVYTTKGCYGIGGDGCARDDGSDYWLTNYYYVPGSTVDFQRGGYLEYDPANAGAAFKYDFSYRTTTNFHHAYNYETGRHGCGVYWCREDVEVWKRIGQDFHRFSVKADYPIAINFAGYDTSAVTVQSAGSILLGPGAIASRNGTLNMSSSAGSIQGLSSGVSGVDTAQSALIAKVHDLYGRDGIGTEASAITLQQVGSGDVKARSSNAVVALRTTSGDLTVNSIDAGTANAYVTAERNLVSIATGADSAVRIKGQDVFLRAVNGAIGTNTTALNLQVGQVNETSKASGGLSAGAAGNINVNQVSGNLYLDKVESQAGDVTISVANGSLYDWNKSETADNRTLDELRTWWSSLGLTGASASAKVVANEASYKQAKEQGYHAYWQLRNVRPKLDANGVIIPGQFVADSFDPGYAYVASAQERANLTAIGWDAAKIATYEADRTAEIHAADAAWGASGYNPGFSYTVSTAESTALAKGGSWTESQLRYSMSLGTIRTTGDTTAQIEDPNVVGRHVTLNALNGSVGKSAGTVELSLANAGSFTDQQKLAAAGAERDDIRVDNVANKVFIDIKDDVDVDFREGGSITINAKNEVYLGSEGTLGGGVGDVNVKAIHSAQGDIRIKVSKGIKDVQTGPDTAAISGRNLLVEGGSGGIGTEADPLKLDLQDGYTLTARATGPVHLKELTGNINLSSLFSAGAASLVAQGSILDALGDGTLKAKVGGLRLDAGGSIGSAGNALEIDSTGGPLVTVSRNGGTHIDNLAAAPLLVDGMSVTGGDLVLRGGTTGLDIRGAVNVTGAGTATLQSSGGGIHFQATGSLDTGSGAIGIDAPTLEMADGSHVRSQTGTITLATGGDMFLSRIETGNATAAALSASSTAGRILEAGEDADVDIVANAAGAGVTLSAAGGIGNATQTGPGSADAARPNAIEMQVASLSAASSAGAIHLSELDGLTVGSALAHGALDLQVGGALTAASLGSATASVNVAAQSAGIASVAAATDVILAATGGDLSTGTVMATGSGAQLSASGALTAGSTTAGGDVQMVAGGSLAAAITTAQNGALAMTSTSGSVSVGTSAQSHGQMTLNAQTGITANSVTTGAGSIAATTATGDLVAITTDSAGAATLTATTGSVQVDVVEGQNGVTVTAGQSIGGTPGTRYTRIESLGGNAVLSAQGGSITGDVTRGNGNVTLTASNGLDLGTTQAVTGALTATAQTGAMLIGSAIAQGAMTLDARAGITANSLATGAGSIAATTATGDLVATTTDSAGAATLAATTGNVKVDVVEGQNDVTVTAGQSIGGTPGTRYTRIESLGGNVVLNAQGGSITGDVTRGSGNVTLTASNGLDLGTTQAVNGALAATAQTGAMLIGSAMAHGAMTLDAQTGITATSLATGAGSIAATTATGDLVAITTDSAGAATLTATTGNVKVDVVEGQNDVTVTAGQSIGGTPGTRYTRIESLAGNVVLNAQAGSITGDLTRGNGNVTLTASNGLDLVTTQAATGALTATAQTGAMLIGSAIAQGAMTLDARAGITANSLATGAGSIAATTATGDLVATTTDSAGAATLAATTGNVRVDVIEGQNDVTVTAGQSIGGTPGTRYTRIESLAGNVVLNAQAGSITGDLTRGNGNVTLTASNGLDLVTTQAATGALTATAQTGAMLIGSAIAQGAMRLDARTGITANSLATGAGSIAATTATGDLVATTTDSAGAATLAATTGNVKVDVVEGQNDVTVTAGQSIGGTPGTRYTRIESLAGNVVLNAQGGSATGNLTRAAQNVQLVAADSIDATTVTASLGNALLTATGGDIDLGTGTANGNITLTAGSDIRVGEVTATTGNATLVARDNITGNLVHAVAGDATMDAQNGAIDVTRVVGGGVVLYARDAIVGDSFEVGRRLVLVSDSVDASIQHTQDSPALLATLIGRNQPVMSNVRLTINSPFGITFDRFAAQNAALNAPTGTIELVSGYIGNRLLVDNPQTHLLMANGSPVVQNPYDIQLYSAPGTFYLYLDRSAFETRGSDIIHRQSLTHTVLSQSTGLDSSAAETSVDQGALLVRLANPPKPPAIQPIDDTVRYTGVPVMLGQPPGADDEGRRAE